MGNVVSREVHIKRAPTGMPTEDDFEIVEVSVPEPGVGQVLVRNIYMSVDPYMRGHVLVGRMIDDALGNVMDGGAIGQVVASNHTEIQVGNYVSTDFGFREYFVADGSKLETIEPNIAPLQAYLGIAGMPGHTAYSGLLTVGEPKPGETVFVSGAAGAVGSIVCQIAKIKDCGVVGSAGSDEKVSWLVDELGVDSAINYKRVDDLSAELGKHCPDKIDIFFDNVGGDHLEAALYHMNRFGRIVGCGIISELNSTAPVPGPPNLVYLYTQRVKFQGFISGDYSDQLPQFYEDMGRWIKEGRMKWRETILEGIENAPKAFVGLFKGDNVGKMLVKIGPDPAI